MPRTDSDTLRALAEAATSLADIESAAIFATMPDSSELELAAAAGIDGLPLERLVAAVKNPAHPIARTVTDAVASFDVIPTAPGGPALRSHLPLFAQRDGRAEVVGVLAVAHQQGLDAETRHELAQIAEQAGRALAAA